MKKEEINKKDENKVNEIVEEKYRFSIQDDILVFLTSEEEYEDEIKEFNRNVNEVAKIVDDEMQEKVDNIEGIINTMSEGEAKERALDKMNILKASRSRNIKEEIDRITNHERKRQANSKYQHLNKQYELIKLNYINKIKQIFELLPDIDEKIELQNYKEILIELKKDIDKLRQYREYDELINIYEEYKNNLEDEEYRRLEKIEKELF